MKFPVLKTKAPIKEMNGITIGIRMSDITNEPIGLAIMYDWEIIDQTAFVHSYEVSSKDYRGCESPVW